MALAPGTRLGPYEILAQIGVGGMGVVYRAIDTNLKRAVAIKVLPDALAFDAERLARFQREAEVLASLNHPNIAAIYGLERTDTTTALVLELVEGPTLADRITGGPIPIDEAFPIARQICEALEAAHEHGIIHRDLKPANIKLRADSVVKVLDFGLAKALASESSVSNAVSSNSPTITSPAAMTGVGVLLGTAAYMSPEQAKGKPADKRSDLWAFGCVLYEMLTGRRAFDGEDVSDTLAAVLRGEPDWNALPQATPAPIRRLLRHCLAKHSKGRIGDASIARIEIDDVQNDPQGVPSVANRRIPLTWAAALALVTFAAAGALMWTFQPGSVPSRLARFPIPLPTGQQFSYPNFLVALSPDGAAIVYSANQQLHMRKLDQLDAIPIPHSEGGRSPFFSPDGQWIGFWQAGQLKKVKLAGGAPVPLCPARGPWGASWTAENTILYGQGPQGPQGIWRVSSDGGTPEPVVKVDADQVASGPQLLPGGRAILFTLASRNDPNARQIVIQSLDTADKPRVVVQQGADARYVPTGHLVYALENSLMAVPFDVAALKVTGDPVLLVEEVATGSEGIEAHFAVSNEGTLVYVPMDAVPGSQHRALVWVDRLQRETPIKGAPLRAYVYARLSPDETRIALDIRDQERGIWIWDRASGTLTPLTRGATWDVDPVWTPDGQSVIFSSGGPVGIGGARTLSSRVLKSNSQGIDMMIPPYYDAPDRQERSIPMRGDDPRHESMFSYVTPEKRVRADHPLRPIRRMTDAAMTRLSPRFDRLYSTTGRPSIPPEQLLRALLLQILYSIRSERLLMEELDYSVLYRWFVGLSMDDPVWDATTFTKNRDRLLDGDIADAFFAEVLAAIQAEGLVSDEHFTGDGTLLEA